MRASLFCFKWLSSRGACTCLDRCGQVVYVALYGEATYPVMGGLILALLLTLGLDTAGQLLGGSAGYAGNYYHVINSGPDLSTPADLSLATLFANLFFLQTIVRPTFGSNGPLWSLANEFWYYVVFPCLLIGAIGRPRKLGLSVVGLLAIGIAALLPAVMVMLGSIWVAGSIAFYVLRARGLTVLRPYGFICLLVSFVLVATFLVVDKRSPGTASDICLGAAFALLLPSVAFLPDFGSLYHKIADSLAKISYTLYATHFPLLAFIWFVALAPRKWPVDLWSMTMMGSLVLCALTAAAAIWWLFERNTPRVREVIDLGLC